MPLFLHVSDIHFRRISGSHYDVDEDLRNELIRDARAFASSHAVPDGILVSGDIAFSGDKTEYLIAKQWIQELAIAVGCEASHVWCVPGNHDIDQRVAKESVTLAEVQEKLRTIASHSPNELNGRILQLMADPFIRGPLFQPLNEYNAFAAAFDCGISADKSFWQQPFKLSDGSILRVNGLTSTLVSNHLDQQQQFVVIGEYQIPQRADGVTDVIMCHHPHDWLRGADLFKNATNSRAPIQLFGHKHVQAIQLHNRSLHIVAGAVHPDRRENAWRPRYNWIHVDVENTGGQRRLNIAVYPRIWSDENANFAADFNMCDGKDLQTHNFALPMWEPSPLQQTVCKAIAISTDDEGGKQLNSHRQLTYRFFELSHVQRIEVAQKLTLLRDEDEGLTDATLYQRIFKRAFDENLLPSLWDTVEQELGGQGKTENPFQTIKR